MAGNPGLRGPVGHATNSAVTRGTGPGPAETAIDDFTRDWQALRADGDIQFAPIAMPEPAEPPGWLKAIGEFFEAIMGPLVEALAGLGRLLGMSGQALMWLLLGLAVLLVGFLIWRRFAPLASEGRHANESPDWAPDASEALVLLGDADRLAAEGRYDEATHLLLKRSVGQIAAARPGLLDPSTTAREIAALPALSDPARAAFAAIAGRVERSLFALRNLSAEDWQAARTAYADFALAAPLNLGAAA